MMEVFFGIAKLNIAETYLQVTKSKKNLLKQKDEVIFLFPNVKMFTEKLDPK